MFHVKVVGALSGHELAVQCISCSTILAVKLEVDFHWDIPVQQQKLVAGDIVPQNDVEVSSLGMSGQLTLHLIREEITDFHEGDHVIAVKDSSYLAWREAGDQGTVTEVESDGGVIVYWDEHCATSPFGLDIPGANPYEMLRIVRSPGRKLRVGDIVVATKSSLHASSDLRPGSEGTVQSIDSEGAVVVSWKDPSKKTSRWSPMLYGCEPALVAVLEVVPGLSKLAPTRDRFGLSSTAFWDEISCP